MKPSRFDYHAPTTLDECIALLGRYGDDAKLLAGGQSLVPMMNLRLAVPEVVIDLNRVAGLASVRRDGDTLVVGAATRHHDVAMSASVREAVPLLAEAAAQIGYPAIRFRGTIGGSLAHADPVSEMPCVAVAVDAQLVLRSPRGLRTVPAGEFFVTHFTSVLEPDELLVEVRFPVMPAGAGWAFVEFARKTGDFAVAAVAAQLLLDSDGRIATACLGLAGVGERPLRAVDAERLLAGAAPGEQAVAVAGEQVAATVARQPGGTDQEREYKAHVGRTLTSRAVRMACERIERGS